jgi:hypothetical protein
VWLGGGDKKCIQNFGGERFKSARRRWECSISMALRKKVVRREGGYNWLSKLLSGGAWY